MPIYEYRRPDGSTFEVLQSFSDEPLTHDPDTGVPVERVLHAPAVHFKGKGFYNTDYGTRKRQRETAAAAAEGSQTSDGGPRRRTRLEGLDGLVRFGWRQGESPSQAPRPRTRRSRQPSPSRSRPRAEARDLLTAAPVTARAQPAMNRATSARRADSEIVSPSSPLGQGDLPGRLQHARGRRAGGGQRGEHPEQFRPLMSEMIAGGAFQAISGRRRKLDGDSSWDFMSVNSACWCSSRWMSVSPGRAQVLARARQRQRLLAVEVVGAGAQAQREAAVG